MIMCWVGVVLFVYVMIICWAGRPVGRVIVRRGKNFKATTFSDTINVTKYQTLHDDTTYWALPVRTTFSDLDLISRTQRCQIFLQIFFFFFNFTLHMIVKNLKLIIYISAFWRLQIFKGDTWHISLFKNKQTNDNNNTFNVVFSQTPLQQDLSNFAWL